jgi:hypothetical protein
VLFKAYGTRYGREGAEHVPALLPQVYLHYDPYTIRELTGRAGEPLKRQRMDFLLLLADHSRVVVEVDGSTASSTTPTATAPPPPATPRCRGGPPPAPSRLRGLPVRRRRTQTGRPGRTCGHPPA